MGAAVGPHLHANHDTSLRSGGFVGAFVAPPLDANYCDNILKEIRTRTVCDIYSYVIRNLWVMSIMKYPIHSGDLGS